MFDYAAAYTELHRNQKHFRGRSIRPYVDQIAGLVELTRPRSLLDYGCGKGWQYSEDRIHERWGGLMPHLYDVGVSAFAGRPAGPFDGVVSVDVLEHIDEPDVDGVLADIFGLISDRESPQKSFAFFVIGCRPARKTFPDGTNLHLTVRPPAWWNDKLTAYLRPGLIVDGYYDMGKGEPQPPLFQ